MIKTAKKSVGTMKKCAFCKYWYDPSNSAIVPRKGQKDVWEYDTGMMRPCRKYNNNDRRADGLACRYFEYKI